MPKDGEGNAERYPKEVDMIMKNPLNSEEYLALLEKEANEKKENK